MDPKIGQDVVRLIREGRTAALGSVLDGHPLVTFVLYNPTPDLSGFDLHVSRLAQHTRALARDPRVGLLIAQPDSPRRNPQTLDRIAIQGHAEPIADGDPAFDIARESYIRRFPQSALNFELGDFFLVRIRPASARFISGFGKIFDLSADDISRFAGQVD
jgi:putative heme iron utilization protein